MNRRGFLGMMSAAAVTPMLPKVAPAAPVSNPLVTPLGTSASIVGQGTWVTSAERAHRLGLVDFARRYNGGAR